LILVHNYRKSKAIRRSLVRQKDQMHNQVKQWMSLAEPEHKRKLSSIETEQQGSMGEAQAQYQQRMDAIAAEHARTLAEIEARYAGG
jgi:hypothetical protein